MISSKLLALAIFALAIVHSLADPPHHQDHQGCSGDSDCGSGPEFEQTCRAGACNCPNKKYVDVPEAKPRCQEISAFEQPCKYDKQCQAGQGGSLSKCIKNKCECYDTTTQNGRDVVRPWMGICYKATAINATCDHNQQCQAFISPESHVRCVPHDGHHICVCDSGIKCEHKNGATSAVASGLMTLGILGLMATRVAM